METIQKVLETIKASDKAMSAGQIAEASGLDRKEVDKAMKELKVSEQIESPRRCYWQAKS